MPADGTHTPHLALRPEPSEVVRDFFPAARQIVLGQQIRRTEALSRRCGVRWSGMDGESLPEVETVENVALDLQRQHARREAFDLTPAGRFYRAAYLIYEATGDSRLLDCAGRGLASNADRAAKLLASCEGPAAEDAEAALTDFLAEMVMA